MNNDIYKNNREKNVNMFIQYVIQNKAKQYKQKLIKADCLNQVIDFIDI